MKDKDFEELLEKLTKEYEQGKLHSAIVCYCLDDGTGSQIVVGDSETLDKLHESLTRVFMKKCLENMFDYLDNMDE